MDPESLPEEKLLNLIRNQKKPNASALPEAVKPPSAKASLKISQKQKPKDLFGVLNRLMLIFVLGLSGYLVYELFYNTKPSEEIRETTAATAPVETAVVFKQEEKPFSYYDQQLANRDIFEKSKKSVTEGAKTVLTNKFKLVGIILGKTPEAVIEDLEKKQTLFLHSGDQVEGAEIISIQEGKIIFLYQDEELELKQ